MSREQHNRLKTSIQKFGFIVPIITNKDLLIADAYLGDLKATAEERLAFFERLTLQRKQANGLTADNLDLPEPP